MPVYLKSASVSGEFMLQSGIYYLDFFSMIFLKWHRETIL